MKCFSQTDDFDFILGQLEDIVFGLKKGYVVIPKSEMKKFSDLVFDLQDIGELTK